ncbi:MAG: 3,4-dihydroxy-2-butanone-4-phosphate synthase [Candidatus Methanoliparum thermophilum]|uniref:3,4-dihydroxy-2-butanone 4-phosphate synthase n=1 Tax=Methanoliparum thermophilum TaxID=2491083 RepID=A0A520KSL7_METT2|nr:3,4-dihydroxy-2-butanone-4-phosphate synthase [Candidatus Methanoliparum sp. LAM-1]RZN64919.1 MAG: 3,4-dihydroxy-2-butanone-4-phosphate synthase [Candidatus Methanoliparum thermophilum]BDC36202.1 3,4-dihydroxy-2-butanone-4-phosphate synthase [Candidatus Methanoliparum sp. LAM-1]
MIKDAIEDIKRGRPILLFDSDDREGETDIVIPAISTTAKDVAMMRKDGGGLICVSIHPDAAKKFDLPFITDLLKKLENNGYSNLLRVVEKEGDLRYDSKSAFSLWVNHVNTFTGITDIDRSLTIRELGRAVKDVLSGKSFDFGSEFRCPGHVPLLRASDNLIYERRGQTELSIALAEMAKITPAMVVCEMLDDISGKALSKDDAKRYADDKGLVFVEGRDVIDEYKKRRERGVL